MQKMSRLHKVIKWFERVFGEKSDIFDLLMERKNRVLEGTQRGYDSADVKCESRNFGYYIDAKDGKLYRY